MPHHCTIFRTPRVPKGTLNKSLGHIDVIEQISRTTTIGGKNSCRRFAAVMISLSDTSAALFGDSNDGRSDRHIGLEVRPPGG